MLSGWFDLTCSGPSWNSTTPAPADYLPGNELPLLHDCARMYIGASRSTSEHVGAAGGQPCSGMCMLRHPFVSPVMYGDADGGYSGLPPVLLQVGEERTLSDSRSLAAALRGSGVDTELQEFPGMPHVFQSFAGMLPEGRRAVASLGSFVARVTAANSSGGAGDIDGVGNCNGSGAAPLQGAAGELTRESAAGQALGTRGTSARAPGTAIGQDQLGLHMRSRL